VWSHESEPQLNLRTHFYVDQSDQHAEGSVMQEVGQIAVRAVPVTDSAEFVALVNIELAGCYRFAGYVLGNEADAEDAVCEAVAKAWQSRLSLKEQERFPAWFGRIVANVCRDRLRKRAGVRIVDLEDAVGQELVGTGDQFRDALARDEVGRLVRMLPEEQLMVVALRFWRDMSLEQIAERLDIPVGTVKSRLHNALRSLRRELDREAQVAS
jgi:RNA polymerase sigma factor (sigma-70 family)